MEILRSDICRALGVCVGGGGGGGTTHQFHCEDHVILFTANQHPDLLLRPHVGSSGRVFTPGPEELLIMSRASDWRSVFSKPRGRMSGENLQLTCAAEDQITSFLSPSSHSLFSSADREPKIKTSHRICVYLRMPVGSTGYD